MSTSVNNEMWVKLRAKSGMDLDGQFRRPGVGDLFVYSLSPDSSCKIPRTSDLRGSICQSLTIVKSHVSG